MSNHKNYNSIVFLTTLSVYLGLVLIGAPPILTQAALTRGFDIKNEIEFKDDLDNKPDKEESENLVNDDFPSLFAQLLNEIKAEVASGKISLPIGTNFNVSGTFTKFESLDRNGGGGGGGLGSNISDQDLSIFIQRAIHEKFKLKVFELADFDGENSKKVEIEIKGDSTEWTLKISFGKVKAGQFAEFLNQEFSSRAASTKDTLSKQIYENTTVSSENNQVFVITRLPRASIDEFLARKDAK